MKFRKYALAGYVCYLLCYLGLVLMSAKTHGPNLSTDAVIDIATFVLLPVVVCAAIGGLIWCFKRKDFCGYAVSSMIFVAPLGILVNLVATYLLWWSFNNA